MKVCKWGNSLAVRLPSSLAAKLNLKEGDEVELTAGANGNLQVDRDLRRERAMAEIARLARPLPPGYRFDREEANARGRDE